MSRLKDKKSKNESSRPRQKRRLTQLAGFAIIVALLLVIASMIASQFFPDIQVLEAPRQVVAQFITPVQKAFAGATDGLVNYLRKLKYRGTLEDEYEKLLQKVDELTDKAMRVETLEYELANAADLNDEISRNPGLDGVRANVIGRDTSNYTYTLTIDVGLNQGVQDYMAVVVPGALIGYTYDVKPNSASVMGIIDSNSSIAALIESSRDQGTIRGTLSVNGLNECRMFYLSYTTLPRPGDRVVTSGVGMEFPKGIPIGFVRESTRGLEDNKQYIVVDPIADFNHIEYVIVYRFRPTRAETADNRGAMSEATFVPLPTPIPVPTFIGQQTALTPSPSASTSIFDSAQPTPPPLVALTPGSVDDVTYVDRVAPETTAETASSSTPVPTAEPTPTFSVDQMTLEEDP